MLFSSHANSPEEKKLFKLLIIWSDQYHETRNFKNLNKAWNI